MLKIAVCDDEIEATGEIEEMLYHLGRKCGVEMEVDVFFDGTEIETKVQEGERYDLIYLNIEMKKMDGLEAARRIRKIDWIVKLIFIAGYENYAKDVFEVRPFRYMVKPIDQEVFQSYFNAAYQEILSYDFYMRFQYKKTNYKILLSDILYFESRKRMVFVIGVKEEKSFYGKLGDVEKRMQNNKAHFLRIHQSYLVNYRHITQFSYNQVELINGMVLPISADRKKEIGERYGGIFGENAFLS